MIEGLGSHGTLRSYGDTAALDDAELRRLLRHGHPLDRVLACWRWLVRGQLLATIEREGPDPGIRRLLLLNLASVRDLEALTIAATFDPDPSVRKDAVMWMDRVAPDKTPALRRDRVVHESDAALACELLEQLSQADQADARTELEAMLRHPDVDRRRHAHAVLAVSRSGRLPPSVREAIEHEEDDALRAQLLARWAASESFWELLKATRRNPRLHVAGYRALIASGRTFPFETLLPLAARAGAEIPLAAIGPPLRDKLRGWLSRRIHAALNEGRDPQAELRLLAQAYEERKHQWGPISRRPPLAVYSHEDTTLAALLDPPLRSESPVPLERIERFLTCPSPQLQMLAAVYLDLRGVELSPAAREVARATGHPLLIKRWAAGPDHAELLALALTDTDESQAMRRHILQSLIDAKRQYPWARLAPLVAELGDNWRDQPVLDALVALLARPYPGAVQAWLAHDFDRRFQRAIYLSPEATAVQARVREALAAASGLVEAPADGPVVIGEGLIDLLTYAASVPDTPAARRALEIFIGTALLRIGRELGRDPSLHTAPALRRFLDESAAALEPIAAELAETTAALLRHAETDVHMGLLWPTRSSVQFLLDLYATTSIAPHLSAVEGTLGRVDRLLRLFADVQPLAPPGTPTTHWWYHSPLPPQRQEWVADDDDALDLDDDPDTLVRAMVDGPDETRVLERLSPRSPPHREIVLAAIEALVREHIVAARDCPLTSDRGRVFDLDALVGEEVSDLVLALFSRELFSLLRPDEETLRRALEYLDFTDDDPAARDRIFRCWAGMMAVERVRDLLAFLADDPPALAPDALEERRRLAALRTLPIPAEVARILERAEAKLVA